MYYLDFKDDEIGRKVAKLANFIFEIMNGKVDHLIALDRACYVLCGVDYKGYIKEFNK